ncbi:hypothetical protein BD770DRAFT_323464, partial [Pilaira anomala]
KACSNWKKDENMVCSNWKPQSPDLNPIENVWMKMKAIKKRRLHNATRMTALEIIVAYEWENVGVDYINKLIYSIPQQMKAVIRNKGYPI